MSFYQSLLYGKVGDSEQSTQTDVGNYCASGKSGNQEMEIRNHVSRMSLRKRQKCFLHIVFLDIIGFDETMNISVKIYLRNCWLVIDARYSLFPQSSFRGFITIHLNDLLP